MERKKGENFLRHGLIPTIRVLSCKSVIVAVGSTGRSLVL